MATGPDSPRPANVARPEASVDAVAPKTVAPEGPLATVAVIVTPAWLTGLPFWSWSCTVGCGAKTTPLWAPAEGPVRIASCPAVPGVTSNGRLESAASPEPPAA